MQVCFCGLDAFTANLDQRSEVHKTTKQWLFAMELCDFASHLCFHIHFVSFRELKSGTIHSFDPPGAQTSQSVVTAALGLHYCHLQC